MATTLANLITYCEDNHWGGNKQADSRKYTEAINGALQHLAVERRWTCWMDKSRIQTKAPVTASGLSETVSVSAGGTTVTATGAMFTADMVGQKITFDSEEDVYEIESFTSTTVVELSSAKPAAVSAGDCKVYYVKYALPSNFEALIALKGIGAAKDMSDDDWESVEYLFVENRDTGEPDRYCISTKLGGHDLELRTYPAPDAVYQHDMIYFRSPVIPTTSTDEIDWPERWMPALKSLIKMKMCEQLKGPQNLYQRAMVEYTREIAKCMASDVKIRKKMNLIGRSKGSQGPRRIGVGRYDIDSASINWQ